MPKDREAGDISGDVPTEEKSNGLLSRDIHFSLEQANLAKRLLRDVGNARDVHIDAQSKWEAFLIGIGMCYGEEIVGGDLDNQDPNRRGLTVKSSNGVIKK
jgi:hypothetical protein|tara:strand:+ start:752 stop:1054 length:303 start_codon:yes stop_codon:yes gene_type:complete